MKRGIKILIVVVVALATNFGLHAAFGWGGHNRNCGYHQNYYHDGYHHHGYDKNHHGCANPWNTYGEQETTKQDTLVR